MAPADTYNAEIKAINAHFDQLLREENGRHAQRLREIAEQETAAITAARRTLADAAPTPTGKAD